MQKQLPWINAFIILNELIDRAVRANSSTKQFSYEYEKIGVLEESGRYSESIELSDKFLEKAQGNSIEHYIHLWKSLALFNMGNRGNAIQELEKADSCAHQHNLWNETEAFCLNSNAKLQTYFVNPLIVREKNS